MLSLVGLARQETRRRRRAAIDFIVHIAMGNRTMRGFVGRKYRVGNVGEERYREILDGIWGLDLDTNVSCPAAYIEHYRQTQLIVMSSPLRFIGSNKTISLVKLVKEHHGQSIAIIKNELQSSHAKWAIHDVDDAAASRAIEMITKLWLMATPPKIPSELNDKLFLRDIVAQGFENSNPRVPAAARSIKEVSQDFSSLNLSRKAGIKVFYTSCLTEHLLMSGKRQLRVFHHASILRKYRELNSVEKNLYPDHLLEEIEWTLELLFPTDHWRGNGLKRRQRLRDKYNVDLEARVEKYVPRDLKEYTVLGDRLAIVQHAYANPMRRGARQWWFDRRDEAAWINLWITVGLFFMMTLIFGVISAVTGIFQGIVAYKMIHNIPL